MAFHRTKNAKQRFKALLFAFITAIFSLLSAPLHAEMIRVSNTIMLNLDESGTPQQANAGINAAIVISLPKDRTFLQGVEILFKVPTEVAQWMDSVEWSLYNGIKPEPTQKRTDYRGQRTTVGTFGDLLSLDIKIPLSRDNKIKQDAYSVFIDDIPDFLNDKIFLRLQPAMKTTPDTLADSIFSVTVKPIYLNKGKLNLTLASPDGAAIKKYTLFIDGEETKYNADGFFLSPGIHNINLVSDYYRNETRTVTVEQAKIADLDIILRDIAPTVRIASPKAATVYFDDEIVKNTNSSFKITKGNHTFKFVIGDYVIIKQLEAVNGKSYTISVNIEALIKEDE